MRKSKKDLCKLKAKQSCAGAVSGTGTVMLDINVRPEEENVHSRAPRMVVAAWSSACCSLRMEFSDDMACEDSAERDRGSDGPVTRGQRRRGGGRRTLAARKRQKAHESSGAAGSGKLSSRRFGTPLHSSLSSLAGSSDLILSLQSESADPSLQCSHQQPQPWCVTLCSFGEQFTARLYCACSFLGEYARNQLLARTGFDWTPPMPRTIILSCSAHHASAETMLQNSESHTFLLMNPQHAI